MQFLFAWCCTNRDPNTWYSRVVGLSYVGLDEIHRFVLFVSVLHVGRYVLRVQTAFLARVSYPRWIVTRL